MKMKMATCYVIASVLVFSTNNADAQLYEYKQLDGTKTQNQANAARTNNDASRSIDKNGNITLTPPTPTSMPFDGGLTLVLAAGAALALKKKFGKKAVAGKPVDSK